MGNINQYGIILDGKMDEPVWETAKEYTGFRKPVYNSGALSEPAIAEIKWEQFSTTFLLKEAITPEALRLEFYNDPVELYELEVF